MPMDGDIFSISKSNCRHCVSLLLNRYYYRYSLHRVLVANE